MTEKEKKEEKKEEKVIRHGVNKIYFSPSTWIEFNTALDNSNEYVFNLYSIYRDNYLSLGKYAAFDTDAISASLTFIECPRPFRIFWDNQDIRQLVIADKDIKGQTLKLRLTNSQRRQVRRATFKENRGVVLH